MTPEASETEEPDSDTEESDRIIGHQNQKPVKVDEVDSTDPNPFNPAGDSLDRLIEMRMNDDVWKAFQGKLPCLEATGKCLEQLQNLAVSNSKQLKAIDERVSKVEEKVAEAKTNNKKTLNMAVFEPLMQSWLKLDDVIVNGKATGEKRGVLDHIFSFLTKPVAGVNEVLSLIGLPLVRNAMGGDSAAQNRSIAIADLEIKIADIKNKRAEVADKIREQVILQVLDFDQWRREFQSSKEIARRETLRSDILAIKYRLGGGDTSSYLSMMSTVDRSKVSAFREWARVRTQLVRIKLLVLGNPDEE